MNNLVVPPSPNWYLSRILACATDNTIIYGSKNEIVVINPIEDDKSLNIKIMPHAHYERIVSVDPNQEWSPGNKMVVSAGDDKKVRLWDMETYQLRGCNNVHSTREENLVEAIFAGKDKIVSVSELGFISVWRFNCNETMQIKNMFTFKVRITTMSSCTHAPYLVAFGLHCGLVVLADLRKSGQILYKMRGHDKSVVSLVWCPTPFNILAQKHNDKHTKKNSSSEHDTAGLPDSINASTVPDNHIKPIDKPMEEVNNVVPDVLETLKKHKLEDGSAEISMGKSELTSPGYHKESGGGEKEDKSTKDFSSSDDRVGSEDAGQKETPAEEQKSSETRTTSDVEPMTSSPDEEELKKVTVSDKCDRSTGDSSTSDDGKNTIESCDPHQVQPLDLDDCSQMTLQEFMEEVKPRPVSSNSHLTSDTELDNEIQEILEPKKEYLLASSARGGSVIIWRAGTDGRKQMELPSMSVKGNKWHKGDKAWVPLCWITPEILLSSSLTAELIRWDLLTTSSKRNLPQKKQIHHDHSGQLFAITAPIVLYKQWEDKHLRCTKNLFAWTLGQDRSLLYTSLQADRTTVVSLPTNGGRIYTLSNSCVDPSRLAVGIGDSNAKLWDLSKPHNKCIIMSNLWQRIQSRVMALSWHPKKDNLLAYGTAEGRIGVVNTVHLQKPPTVLSQYFRSSVYCVQWGPLEGNKEHIGLYAVSEGKVVTYDTKKQSQDPTLMEFSTKEHILCISWKPNFDMVVFGSKNGCIIVFDTKLNHIKTIYSEYKSIYCLIWQPPVSDNETGDSNNLRLALASSSASVVIYDLSIENEIDSDVDKRKVVLDAHIKPVRSVCWSPCGGMLVSGSDDGVAFVWDVKSKTVISTFTGHNFEPVMAVLWSPVSSGYIITGGRDSCIRIWTFSEHPPIESNELTKLRNYYSDLRHERRMHTKEAETDSEGEAKKTKVKRDVMLYLTTRAQNREPNILLKDCVKLFNFQNQDTEFNISTSSNDSSEKEVPKESTVMEESHPKSKIDVLQLFGGRLDVLRLVNDEQEYHTDRKKIVCSQHLQLWKGQDMTDMLKTAIEQGNVTPWLITMAPTVSPKLWIEACEVYAKKLMEDAKSDPMETVSYLLVCNKVRDAINVLCKATLYREALTLAKCRLPEDDPEIDQILYDWATFGITNGCFEISTQCYIKLGKYEEAAKALFKRTNLEAMKFTIALAEKSQNQDLVDACTLRYNNFKLHKEKAKLSESSNEPSSPPDNKIDQNQNDDKKRKKTSGFSDELLGTEVKRTNQGQGDDKEEVMNVKGDESKKSKLSELSNESSSPPDNKSDQNQNDDKKRKKKSGSSDELVSAEVKRTNQSKGDNKDEVMNLKSDESKKAKLSDSSIEPSTATDIKSDQSQNDDKKRKKTSGSSDELVRTEVKRTNQGQRDNKDVVMNAKTDKLKSQVDNTKKMEMSRSSVETVSAEVEKTNQDEGGDKCEMKSSESLENVMAMQSDESKEKESKFIMTPIEKKLAETGKNTATGSIDNSNRKGAGKKQRK